MKTVALPPLASREDSDMALRRQALREVEVLRTMTSPHVVQYVEAILVPATGKSLSSEMHIFTEYCEVGDLATYLRKRGSSNCFRERDIWSFVTAILAGLRDLHDQGILHRDLKPANIFLKRSSLGLRTTSTSPGNKSMGVAHMVRFPSSGTVGPSEVTPLIGDLGVARTITETQPLASTMVGTPHYCAPEIFEGELHGEKADIYSFGICTYELMHGRTPYADVQNVAGLVRRVLRLDLGDGKPSMVPMDLRFTAELRAFVADCLALRPGDRPTAAELLLRASTTQAAANACQRASSEDLGSRACAEIADVEHTRPQSHDGCRRRQSTGGCNRSTFQFRPVSRSRSSRGFTPASRGRGEKSVPSTGGRTIASADDVGNLSGCSGDGGTVEASQVGARQLDESPAVDDKQPQPRRKDLRKEPAPEVTLMFAEVTLVPVEDDSPQRQAKNVCAGGGVETAAQAPSTDDSVAAVASGRNKPSAITPTTPGARGPKRFAPKVATSPKSSFRKASHPAAAVGAGPRCFAPPPRSVSAIGLRSVAPPSGNLAPSTPQGAEASVVAPATPTQPGGAAEVGGEYCERFLRERRASCGRRPGCVASSGEGGKRDLMVYVSRAHECWARWRRERLQAKQPSAGRGWTKASTPNRLQPSLDGSSDGCEALEVRGIAKARTPKAIRGTRL